VYIVYEYDLYGHPIMWDQENLYVHFTGIWKALGKTKADIVKIIDANPILESIIRKVRGGFLKIQGTWYSIVFLSVLDTETQAEPRFLTLIVFEHLSRLHQDATPGGV